MSKPLSIGMMVRSFIPVPKPDSLIYAPIPLMIQLAKGLADKGHRITIFASSGSQLNYPNITVETLNLPPLATSGAEFQQFLSNTELLAHSLHSLQDWHMAQVMFEQAHQGKFDLLHFHHPEVGLPLAKYYPDVPVMYTLHDPIEPEVVDYYAPHLTDNQEFITISRQQASQASNLPIKATIHHGFDLPPLNPDITPDETLLFVGRIIPEKGVKEAIYVAEKSNRDLLIIGPTISSSKAYFDREIAPHLNSRIRYLGRINHEELSRYYQQSAAVLTPILWDEPFGLTCIEAMANGTPVIALNRGAAPELIVDGQTGFVVDTLEDMVEAVSKLNTISHQQCRQHIQDNFSTAAYVGAMEQVFREAVEGRGANELLEDKTAGLQEDAALPQG